MTTSRGPGAHKAPAAFTFHIFVFVYFASSTQWVSGIVVFFFSFYFLVVVVGTLSFTRANGREKLLKPEWMEETMQRIERDEKWVENSDYIFVVVNVQFVHSSYFVPTVVLQWSEPSELGADLSFSMCNSL